MVGEKEKHKSLRRRILLRNCHSQWKLSKMTVIFHIQRLSSAPEGQTQPWFQPQGVDKYQITHLGISLRCPTSQGCPCTARGQRAGEGAGRHACRKRDTVPLGSYFQHLSGLYVLFPAAAALTLWLANILDCEMLSAAEEAAAGQTDGLEEISALVDRCQSWQQHYASLLLHTGFGPLSAFCKHTQMQHHIHSQMGEIWSCFASNRESLSEENATQRHFSLSFHCLGQGVPQEEDNTVRGWTMRQRKSHNRANESRKWKISQPSPRDFVFLLGSQAFILIVLLLGTKQFSKASLEAQNE